nr:hypothetical protein GCM10020093_012510 [Planobispora longispora]
MAGPGAPAVQQGQRRRLRRPGGGPEHRRNRRNDGEHDRGDGQTVADPHRLRPPDRDVGRGRFLTAYPCYPEEIRLGGATARDAYCYADSRPGGPGGPGREGFDVLANFSHSFYKPYHVTLDFTDMKVYLARGKAA